MTLAYGSKEYGFRDQILVDTIQPDIDAKAEASIFADSKNQAARYLAKLVWDAVGTTVVKAVEGMKWLQDCAKAVTKDKQVVSWKSSLRPLWYGVLESDCVYMITPQQGTLTNVNKHQV